MQLSYSQKVTVTAILVFLVMVIMLGLVEGTVRIRQWLVQGDSGKLGDIFVQQNGLRGLQPDARMGNISINSLGFRGPPLTQPKPADNLRIAFVGASTTFCAEVSGNNMTWPHLVTEAIQKEYPDISVDYVNAAVPGYTVKTSLLNFSRRVVPLQPDVAIIYHATNDLSWESRILAEEQGVYAGNKGKKNSWLAEHSQLWYLATKNLQIKEAQRSALDARQRLEFSPAEIGEHFRQHLTQLVIEAKKISGVVALVTFSHRIRPEQTPEEQLQAAGSALYYMPFMEPQGLMESFRRYNRIISDVASDTGAVLIDGEAMIPANSKYFNDTVHFKDAGSRVMAQRVSAALLENTAFRSLAAAKRGQD